MRDQSGHHRRPSGSGLREVAVVPMRARGTREEESNRTRLMLYTDPPMTLGNMRANGVRTLAQWCRGRGSFFTERSADGSIILYWQHDGPNSRR
jgi:hypothetical protein